MKKHGYLLFLILLLAACKPTTQTSVSSQIPVSVLADGKTTTIQISANSTVQAALTAAGITLNSLDRVDPAVNTIVATNDQITVVRVREEYSEQNEVIPFERQVIKNESLPEGETRLLQAGVNGEKVVTYKKVFEDNQEISNLVFKTVVVNEATPEITMMGVQAPFSSQPISGVLAYLNSGNAWVLEGATGSRRPVVTTGDLDGHIFAISYDREWLLFSRQGNSADGVINSLWVVRLTKDGSEPMDLKINNVVNFADFIPNSGRTVAYSTVESRESAPGWQANNDLYYKTFSASSTLGSAIQKVDANSGGIYGWWGINYVWAPDGSRLAFTRPDSIGTVVLNKGLLNTYHAITPYDTHSDWAWVPGISWTPDGKFILTGTHDGSASPDKPESSAIFDLTAVAVDNQSYQIKLVKNTGMFTNPVASPFLNTGNYLIGYFQAIFPDQSETSRYRLMVMEQDGSNKTTLFPEEGSPGLTAQSLYWAPDFQNGAQIAVIYDGNLWLVNAQTKEKYQVTGDGLVSRISWR